MLRHSLVAALAAASFALALVPTAAAETLTQTKCMSTSQVDAALGNPDLDVVACAEGTVSGTAVCTRTLDAKSHCVGHLAWSARGWSPANVPGEAAYQGGATVSWCPPNEFCRSYGVSFVEIDCHWVAPTDPPCASGEQTYDLDIGAYALAPGACMDFSIDAFVYSEAGPSPVLWQALGTAEVIPFVHEETTTCG